MSSAHPMTPRSRFLEGSMNDRTSAVPPPRFLGPDALSRSTASVPNFHHRDRDDDDVYEYRPPGAPPPSRGRARPGAAAAGRARSASISEKRGLTGLWEGLREKLWGRKRPVSLDGGAAARARGPPARPTREELLASYNELVDAGFFQARAIHGSRLPPPRPASSGAGAAAAAGGGADGRAYFRPRLETIYSPSRPELASPARNGGGRGTALPEMATPTQQGPSGGAATTPDSRGKKRAHDADAEGAAEGEKSARKLRRTTSSITELHARLRRVSGNSRPPVSYAEPGRGGPSGSSSSSISSSSSGGGGGVMIRRSVSGNKLAKRYAWPPGEGGGREEDRRPVQVISGPVTPVVRLGPGTFDALRADPPGLRRVQGEGALRARPGPPVRWVAADEDEGAAEHMPTAGANWVAHPGAGQSSPGTQQQSQQGGLVRGPVTRRQSQRHHAQLRAQRLAARKKEPLSVVPDANRGIPNVPAIPAQYKHPADTVMEDGEGFHGGDSFAEDALLP